MSAAQWIAMGVAAMLVAAGVWVKHWLSNGPWKKEDFFLGAELMMATAANGANTLTKDLVDDVESGLLRKSLFVAFTVAVLVLVLMEHKRTERSSDERERDLVLALGTNIAGMAFFCCGFVIGVS